MQYALLLYRREELFLKRTPEETARAMAAHRPYIEMLRQKGHFVATAPLTMTPSATTLRNESGRIVTTDGPFAETREQFGGYYVIEAKDLDEALVLAKQCPVLDLGMTIEVRPVIPYVV